MDDAYTRLPTPADATASRTRMEPRTLFFHVSSGSWVGRNTHARCTTASTPAKRGSRSSTATSACTQSVFGSDQAGRRRAMPTTWFTASSVASRSTRLVPTFPVAPMMTTRMTAPPRLWQSLPAWRGFRNVACVSAATSTGERKRIIYAAPVSRRQESYGSRREFAWDKPPGHSDACDAARTAAKARTA